jgi:hypothetical protein
VPITEVPADQLHIGDLIRTDHPQAHQILDITTDHDNTDHDDSGKADGRGGGGDGDDGGGGGQITLTVAPIGLINPEPTRMVLTRTAAITRVGTAND